MKRKLKNQSFTLVEILLALAILGIGLVSILSLFAIGVNSAKSAIDVTRAGLAVQMTLETIKQQGYSNLSNGQQTLPNLTDWNGDTIQYYTDFTREMTVTQNPTFLAGGQPIINSISNWRKIELLISYANNDKEIAHFMTYITKNEP